MSGDRRGAALGALARGLAVSLASVAFCALVAEAALRLANPLELDWRMLRTDRERTLALGADFDGSFKGVRVKTNQFGHRVPTSWEKRYDRDKPPGAFRILVFGDSFTFGDEWPAEATFVEQLQQRFDPTFRRVQVLNFGVFGYGPVQEWRAMRDEALAFQPDAVIIQFCDANDLIPFRPDGWLGRVRRHSYLQWVLADLWYHGRASVLSRRLGSWLPMPPPESPSVWLGRMRSAASGYYARRLAALQRNEAGWRQARQAYRQMAVWLAERNVPIGIVVTAPNFDLGCAGWECHGVSVRYRELLEPGRPFYAELARQLGALTPAYLSLDETFGPYAVEQLYDGPTWHYGPRKGRVIAQRLAEMLGSTSSRLRTTPDVVQGSRLEADRILDFRFSIVDSSNTSHASQSPIQNLKSKIQNFLALSAEPRAAEVLK